MSVKICVSGKMAAGKSTISKILTSYFKFERVSFGDIIRESIRKLGVEPTRENQHRLSEEIVQTVGNTGAMDWFVENSLDIDWGGNLIIEGCRHPDTFLRMQSIFDNVILLHCSCSESEQIARIQKRDGFSIEKIKKLIKHPVEEDFDNVFSRMADVVNGENIKSGSVVEALAAIVRKTEKEGNFY